MIGWPEIMMDGQSLRITLKYSTCLQSSGSYCTLQTAVYQPSTGLNST